MRLTLATAQLVRVFLDDVDCALYGYELMKKTRFPSGKVYPILHRLVESGWLTVEMERIQGEYIRLDRPPRKMYRLTSAGVDWARCELTVLSNQLRPPPS